VYFTSKRWSKACGPRLQVCVLRKQCVALCVLQCVAVCFASKRPQVRNLRRQRVAGCCRVCVAVSCNQYTFKINSIHWMKIHSMCCLYIECANNTICMFSIDRTRCIIHYLFLRRQCVAVCCSVLQCVAVCCSVLQCVAVCCSVVLISLIH